MKTMTTLQMQMRAMQPTVPPMMAAVLLGLLEAGSLGVDWALGLVEEPAPAGRGVVLLGEVDCGVCGELEDAVLEEDAVAWGLEEEEDDVVGGGLEVEEGFALVVKALYSSVRGAPPQAR
jgi:hypothetical protein